MKKILGLLFFFGAFSLNTFANPIIAAGPFIASPVASLANCPQALATTDPNFCGSFKTAAVCFCSLSLPAGKCQDLGQIYKFMIGLHGSIENACRHQPPKGTTPQICIDDWYCYLNGGVNSQGALCSSTGNKCA